MIIGISGKMGVGKDYIVEHMLIPKIRASGKRVLTISFADQIKINAASQNNIDIITMYGDKTPEIRKMLQTVGTEQGRMKHGEDIWIKYVSNWIKLWKMKDLADVFIITDCRFKNEVRWVESQGIVIRIEAPDRNLERLKRESNGSTKLLESIQSHVSETELDDYDFKYTIDNSKKTNQDLILCFLDELRIF